jgi:SAM-dependent methyltransferase
MTDLLRQDSHFAFGENWASYAKLVSEARITQATERLRHLVGGQLDGKRFLDIGCGSGLHALAALRLGAASVLAIDLDPNSVATARQLLQGAAAGKSWDVQHGSVFELSAATVGQFDVVYSWGVLHHTGDMYRALRCATSLVGRDGRLVVALYRRTPLCWLWKLEKRWYAKASRRSQSVARRLYIATFRTLYVLVKRRSFSSYVKDYSQQRGMDFEHDVHDWLGGWPYESASIAQLERFMRQLGLRQERRHLAPFASSGILGSACDEYVYVRA